MKLNPEQESAVRHVEGPLLIFAGAGSGKTRVITNRIVYLIQKKKIDPKHIVALSFTNKSSKEMRERVRKSLIKKEGRGLTLSTFHSLGLNILKKYIDRLGFHMPFMLQTPGDLESLLIDSLKQRKIDPKLFPPKLILSHISRLKNMGADYKRSLETSGKEIDLIVLDIFDEYVQILKNMNSVDFDDLILLPMKILRDFPEVKEHFHKKHKFYMIDEFQDTNQVQYEFIKLLLNDKNNICVVGDDDQSIYGFRGSNVNLILDFEKDFKNTKVVRLLQNYRSSMNILNAANSLIKNNTSRREKKLWSEIHHLDRPLYVERQNEKDEAIFVVDEIQNELIKEHRQGSEIAILFRTNYQSRPFEEELRLRGVPYKLIGAYNFFDRKEVKDLVAYIRVIANPKDEISLLRILNYPKRGIGQTSIGKIQQKSVDASMSVMDVLHKICEEPEFIPEIKRASAALIYEFLDLLHRYRSEFYTANKMTEVLRKFIKEIGFEKEISTEETDEKVMKARMLNLSELANMMSYFEEEWDSEGKPTLFDFIARLSLLTNDDDSNEKDARDNRVQLMTMHLSKGLEFEVVFLVGIEEGIIPNSRVIDEGQTVDEERRLFYVGMTRARRKLFMTGASERKKYGESMPCQPSRFLDEISRDYLDVQSMRETTTPENFLEELERLKSS